MLRTPLDDTRSFNRLSTLKPLLSKYFLTTTQPLRLRLGDEPPTTRHRSARNRTAARLLGEAVLLVLERDRKSGNGNAEANDCDKASGDERLVEGSLKDLVHVAVVVALVVVHPLAGRGDHAARGRTISRQEIE